MMPPDPDEHSDPAVTSVSLAAEAALLEARLRMLREELGHVDVRIKAISDTLRLLGGVAPASAETPDGEERCGSCGPSGRGNTD
ncbi:hypothetical protein SRB17_19790 [Streptomyces sp. RB17]|uniref:hypothetical protein n=1 Tax=Streptomyces sp. RB17 TaxID=2585197 RepID=UPI0012961D0D|nr:hypothetical protein [Streptomyces sp. RB17]MQY34013.1 hypothetical protein [Streptomyces sp. RB17]